MTTVVVATPSLFFPVAYELVLKHNMVYGLPLYHMVPWYSPEPSCESLLISSGYSSSVANFEISSQETNDGYLLVYERMAELVQ